MYVCRTFRNGNELAIFLNKNNIKPEEIITTHSRGSYIEVILYHEQGQ